MDKGEAEEYLKKLENLEKNINSDDDDDEGIDLNFIGELNELLSKLEQELKVEQPKQTTPNTPISEGVMVKVKKLDPNAVIPSYSKVGDAGMDLTITKEIENTSFSVSYGFGIAMEIPKGYVGLVFPRSSVRNQDLILSNCVGVIDSGYRGEIQATFKKTNGLDSLKYNVGERGAQIIILPYPQVFMTEVPELSNSERGEGGFGSTGK
jgi:dUTP pyrophosphatase